MKKYKYQFGSLFGKRFICFNETPDGPETQESSPAKMETSDNLDESQSKNNKELAAKFMEDFSGRMEDGKVSLPYKKGNVDYTYTFEDNGDGTVTITQINETEINEEGETESRSATVTYARLYANKVLSMPGVGKLIQENTESNKEQRRVQIEAGVAIPKTSQQESGEGYEEQAEYGGEISLRYMLTDPSSPYVAATGKLYGRFEDYTYLPNDQSTILSEHTTFSFGAGAGIEGGLPIGPVIPYVGAGITGEVNYTDYTDASSINGQIQIDEGTNMEFKPGAYVTGGVRVQPTDWMHLFGAATARTGGSPTFVVGAGVGF